MKLSPALLVLFAQFVGIACANLAQQRLLCSNRCKRILKRSLQRNAQFGTVEEILYRTIDYGRKQILASLEQRRANDVSSATNFAELSEPLRTICWKFFDFEDCASQCDRAFFRRRKRKNDKKVAAQAIGHEQRMVLQFCHQNNFGVSHGHFACIHKFHAFVEIGCSAYQQKAVELRLMGLHMRRRQLSVDEPNSVKQYNQQQKDNNDGITQQQQIDAEQIANAIEKEVCLLLHQHSTCLGNALGRHCPFARSLFASRHSLRDHFLSFVLPFGTVLEREMQRNVFDFSDDESGANLDRAIELDQLFSEKMLDKCQLLDFNRIAAQWHASNMMLLDDQQQKTENRRTTKRAIDSGTMPETAAEAAVPSMSAQRRRLFSSDEDLLDIPPNFHYSSARLPADFHTRYAICRAQPVAHSTLVQLLPDTTPMSAQSVDAAKQTPPKWPHTAMAAPAPSTTPSAAVRHQTQPDPMLDNNNTLLLSTNRKEATMALLEDDSVEEGEREEEMGQSVKEKMGQSVKEKMGQSITRHLPYLINGHATVPQKQWTTEATNVERRTEIRLLDDDVGLRRTWTESVTPTAPQPMPTTSHGEEGAGRNGVRDQKMPTSSSQEGHHGTERHLSHLRGDANNVYFAKILHFDGENNGVRTATADDGIRGGGTEVPQSAGRVTAYLEHHSPREQLEPVKQKAEDDRSLELDQSVSSAEEDDDDDYLDDDDPRDDDNDRSDFGVSEERDASRYAISAAAILDLGWPSAQSSARPRLADLSPKSRAPFDIQRRRPSSTTSTDGHGRIVVTAERVPTGHSGVLLVLLSLYGTFFGVAGLLLLCLLFACLERRRRRHGAAALLLGRCRRKYCLSPTSAKKGGSAILYLDERLGTVKSVRGK